MAAAGIKITASRTKTVVRTVRRAPSSPSPPPSPHQPMQSTQRPRRGPDKNKYTLKKNEIFSEFLRNISQKVSALVYILLLTNSCLTFCLGRYFYVVCTATF